MGGREKRKREAAPLEDLAEADENPPISYPDLSQKADADSLSADDGSASGTRKRKGHPRQSGSGSTFSGTTARTSGSGQDFSDESALHMLDTCEDLSKTSDRILALLVPREISETSVKTLKTRLTDSRLFENKQLARYTANFNRERDVYGNQRFVQVAHVFEQSHNVSSRWNDGLGVGRMKPILYKANITSLVSATLLIDGGGIEDSINELDQVFPMPFLDCFVDASSVQGMAQSSALLKESLRLGLDIRTRKFIDEAKGLAEEPGFDFNQLLQQTFHETKNELRGWSVTGLRNQDISQYPRLRNMIRDRLEQLREIFSGDEALSNPFEVLDKEFSHTRLATHILDWCQIRLEEIRTQYQAMDEVNGRLASPQPGNKEQIANTSSSGRNPPLKANADTALSKVQNEQAFDFGTPKARHVAIPVLKGRMASILASKGRKGPSSNAVQPATPTAAAGDGPHVPASAPAATRGEQMIPLESVFSSHDEESLFVPEAIHDQKGQVNRVLHRHVELTNERDKENFPLQSQSQLPRNSQHLSHGRANPIRKRAFIDPQPNAVRVGWDDTQEETSGDSRQPTVEAAPSGSRGEDDDPSQDVGFQTGSHKIAHGNRHPFASSQPKPRTSQARPTGTAPIIQNGDEVLATQDDEPEDDDDWHDRQSLPPPSQLEHYEAAKQGSKLSFAQRSKDRKLPVPWSPDQTERLLKLIEKCQGSRVSWAQIMTWDKKKKNPKLQDRDQVAIKDKAMNMKMDFLRSDLPLPRNFQHIRIRERSIKELRRLGIDYDAEIGKRTDDTNIYD
ncbi:MAG: hypothetical protein Q9183_003127 [Haloplaca sp. 2 TL-2023]